MTPIARDSRTPAAGFKRWKARTLKREDWDFSALSNWPREALEKAWIWELEREIGSGEGPCVNGMKPPTPPAPPMLKSYYFDELTDDIANWRTWIGSGDNDFTTIQPIEIDWTKSETEIIEEFRNWLRNGDHPFEPSQDKGKYERMSTWKKRKHARKTDGYLAWLRELAIFRISAAGFTRKRGLTMLACSEISPPNWEHAQARTLQRIQNHLKSLHQKQLEDHFSRCHRL